MFFWAARTNTLLLHEGMKWLGAPFHCRHYAVRLSAPFPPVCPETHIAGSLRDIARSWNTHVNNTCECIGTAPDAQPLPLHTQGNCECKVWRFGTRVVQRRVLTGALWVVTRSLVNCMPQCGGRWRRKFWAWYGWNGKARWLSHWPLAASLRGQSATIHLYFY